MAQLHALLLTDIVDSTRLTEELGDARMAELWIAHDRIARDLLPLWRGREIDKTDGMLLLFDAVVDAVGYALAYHRKLAATELPFKARAGIHVGPVTLRPNPADDVARGAKPVEVDGLALPITARVMSVALGAQTLLSADARLALGVATQRVLSHGHWRMHGVADPVELFEIGEADAPFSTPPDGPKVYRVMRQGDLWQPVREVRHSVPAERDSFVGRQEPLQLIARKLEEGARLISVLGIGGTGKTRLVTRFAWAHLGDYPGGVWFCDLSQARTLDGIFFAVAQGLDVPLGKTDPVVQLAHAIAGRGECLVIVDNFEQVARHAEETLGRWLERAPQARFVVTTREVLGIVGEEMLALEPLDNQDAAKLFLRRAESARQKYSPSSDDLIAIDQLVTVLDGLPLAIELAAARIRVMRPSALLAKMHERFSVLWSRSGRRDRQATLRAAFDWSWELLTEPEKVALAQLSVFEGGFDLASVEAVLELSVAAAKQPEAADIVQWLVDKSLVRQVKGDRFNLLESVREYAAEHLRTAGRFSGSGGPAATAAQARHWRHFAKLEEQIFRQDGDADTNNLVAACRRASRAGDADSATGSLVRAWSALKLSGPFGVALQLADEVGAIRGLDPSYRAAVDWVAGSAHQMLGHVEAAWECFIEGLRRSREVADGRREAEFMCALGESVLTPHEEQFTLLWRALALADQMADATLKCRALNALGTLCSDLGRPIEARQHYVTALEIARIAGDERWQGGLLGNLGTLLYGEGHFEAACETYLQGLAFAQKTGDRRWEGNARCNLGLLFYEQGQASQAFEQFEQALATARSLGHAWLECTVLCNLGLVLEVQGDVLSARSHYEKAIELASELRDARSEGQFRGHLGLLLAKVGEPLAALACMDLGEALLLRAADQRSLAILLCQRAHSEHMCRRHDAARAALEHAQIIATSLSADADSELGRALSSAQSRLLGLVD